MNMNRLRPSAIASGVGAAVALAAGYLGPFCGSQADENYNAQVNTCAAQMGDEPSLHIGPLDSACDRFYSQSTDGPPLRTPYDATIYKFTEPTTATNEPTLWPKIDSYLSSADVFRQDYLITDAKEADRQNDRWRNAFVVSLGNTAVAGGATVLVQWAFSRSRRERKIAPLSKIKYEPRPIADWEWKQSFRRMEEALSNIPDITYNSTNTQ